MIVPFWLTQVFLVIVEISRYADSCFNAEPALAIDLCVGTWNIT